jgi:hypothetical protein
MNLENIDAHIKNLSKEDWDKLFSLIPIIESIKVFSTGGELIEDENDPDSYEITPEHSHSIVYDFLDIMVELDLIIDFNWPEWDYGKNIIRKNEYKGLDTITLLKLISAFIRQDHFSYGEGLASRFEDRTIEKILKELKKNIENMVL